jgi:excinuclease ABC subunit C
VAGCSVQSGMEKFGSGLVRKYGNRTFCGVGRRRANTKVPRLALAFARDRARDDRGWAFPCICVVGRSTIKTVLTERIEFRPEIDSEVFSAAPSAPAVFLLRADDPHSEPYVSKTANLRRRLQRLLSVPEEKAKRLNLRDRVRWVEYTLTGSDFESGFVLYAALRSAFPKTYSNRLRLRFAPLVKLHLENEFPRASITTQLGRLSGKNVYYGPFASRVSAEKFMNDALDFFKMRRCVEDLHPDPQFPGCIYSEMKMCLAPCFRGCTDDEYRAEVVRVEDFLDSRGESLKRRLATERDEASATMEFETAAAIHARIDKLMPLLHQLPEFVQRIDRCHAVIVQKSRQAEHVTLFRFDGGVIGGPLEFPISATEHAKSQSMEARIQDALTTFPAAQSASAIERMEHLAILKRWCYRGTRGGEIFFADFKGQLPMRRLVRGIGRVYKGEPPETALAATPPGPVQSMGEG